MWVSKIDYLRTLQERDENKGRADAFEKQLVTQQAAFEWLKVLTNQYAHERSALLANIGIKVPTATVEVAPPSPEPNLQSMFGANPFQDAGDEAATAMGLGWDEQGNLKHNFPV